MNRPRLQVLIPSLLLAAVVATLAGCSKKEISSIDRKTAENQMAEARFAVTLHDWPRAEGLAIQASKLCPDTGDFFMFLGNVQAQQAKKSDARSAYTSALSAYKDAYKAAPTNSQILVQQLYVLILLGRPDDAKSLLQKAVDANPTDRLLKSISDGKAVDRMMADPGIKALSA